MLRYFLLFGIILMTFMTIGLGYIRLTEIPPQQIVEMPNTTSPIPDQKTVPAVINEINARNATVRTVDCDHISVKTWEDGIRFSLDAELAYEKDTNFRLKLYSFFGLELDLGSNERLFWFWSRRNKAPGLHYAVYEDYHKTRLKTPFNPVWMRTTLGLERIVTDDAQIIENDKDYIVVRKGQNALGKDILNAVFVSKQERRIRAVMITDTKGVTLASCEITHDASGLPQRLVYNWNEEKRVMVLELRKAKKNRTLSSSMWSMPDIEPRVDMGKE